MNISFWKHHPISDQSGEILAAETIAFYNEFKPDFVKITPAGTWIATCYGLVDYYEEDTLGRRFPKEPLIKTIDDFAKIQLFNEFPTPLIEQLKAAELTCDEIHEVPVYATIFSPITQAIQLCSLPTFIDFLNSYPTESQQLLDILAKNTETIIKEYITRGIEGIYYANQSCQTNQVPKELYATHCQSFDESCIQYASNLVQSVLYHLHGEDVYFSLKENIPFVTIHIEETNSNSIKTDYPIIVGIPVNTIDNTLEENMIKEVISHYKNESNLILCACVLPISSTNETIHKWINTVIKI